MINRPTEFITNGGQCYLHLKQVGTQGQVSGIRHATLPGNYRLQIITTRSQAVARIADHTASQHLRGPRDVIGLVTI